LEQLRSILQTDVKFSSICPVIDHDFRHNVCLPFGQKIPKFRFEVKW